MNVKNLYVSEAYALPVGQKFDVETNSWGDPKAKLTKNGEYTVFGHAKIFDHRTGMWFNSVVVK